MKAHFSRHIPVLLLLMGCTSTQESVKEMYSKQSVCQQGDCVSGTGKILIKQKFTYDGAFSSGLPEGTGRLSANNQQLYYGEWSKGLPAPEEERNVVRELLEGDGLEEFDKTSNVRIRKSSLICTIIFSVLAQAPRICVTP